MKKIILSILAVLAFGFTNAQETRFGLKAGVDLATSKVKFPGGTITGSDTGFYLGGFVQLGISEKFSVQPEVLFIAIPDFNVLSVPVLGKFEVVENISLMAGPSFNYLLDAEEDEFKLNLDFGGSYDISENFDINAKYSLGFGDVTLNGIFLGVGYKF